MYGMKVHQKLPSKDLRKQKKESANLKIGPLELSSIRHRKRKEEKLMKAKRSVGHHQAMTYVLWEPQERGDKAAEKIFK